MTDWAFEHAVATRATLRDAWAFWSDLRNHAEMEPGVESIELDGPFETGTKGRTIGANFQQEWELSEVIHEKRFVIAGAAPGFVLSFAWMFESDGTGTRMTQRISAEGPRTKEHESELRQMEVNAPTGMARLAARLDRLDQRDH